MFCNGPRQDPSIRVMDTKQTWNCSASLSLAFVYPQIALFVDRSLQLFNNYSRLNETKISIFSLVCKLMRQSRDAANLLRISIHLSWPSVLSVKIVQLLNHNFTIYSLLTSSPLQPEATQSSRFKITVLLP